MRQHHSPGLQTSALLNVQAPPPCHHRAGEQGEQGAESIPGHMSQVVTNEEMGRLAQVDEWRNRHRAGNRAMSVLWYERHPLLCPWPRKRLLIGLSARW